MKVIGIDLAGLEKNPSGFAILCDLGLETRLVYSDNEMIELCSREHPNVVAIDAPLSMPKRGNLRRADASLIERGFRVLPPTFGSMKSLTKRGIRLARELRKRGLKVIEIHPRTSGIVLFGKADRRIWISELQKRGWKPKPGASEHEIDAMIAALTGVLHLKRKAEEVGTTNEGTIIIPRKGQLSL